MIILSLPYRNEQSLRTLEVAGLTEYRLDFCSKPQSIDFTLFDHSCILTCKCESLGPELVCKMMQSSALVDLDLDDPALPSYLPSASKLIISLHMKHFDRKRIEQLLKLPGAFYARKIVFEAMSFEEILQTQAMIKNSDQSRVIFNVTGRYAAFQRPLYRFFSSFAVYLYYSESTYPGQLSFAQFHQISGTGIRKDSSIYGIIGGAQVSTSYSLEAYNQYFRDRETDAHYLPIPAKDCQEAIRIIQWLQESFHTMGFSITSPFKTSLSEALELGSDAINTICLHPQPLAGYHHVRRLSCFARWANTDLDALRASLAQLDVNCEDSIFIYGSGACAEAFVQYLVSSGYHSITLGGRNTERVTYLRTKYSLSPSDHTSCQLLINASSRLSFDEEADLPGFAKLIDLPYQNGKSSDLQKLAWKLKLPHVCGSAFFELQHLAQRAFLLE